MYKNRYLLVRFVKWLIKGLMILAVFGVIAIGLLLGSLRLEHGTEIALPAPTGPFSVGLASFAWTADGQIDELAPLPETKRELVVWVWFPSAPEQPVATHAAYLPTPWRTAIERQRGTLISDFLMRDLSLVRTNSIRNSAISPQQRTYPVVIMRAGLSALTTQYSILAEDLASHGYIVVGFDAPYRTAVVVFPDGRVISRTAENNADAFLGKEQDRVVNRLLTAWSADIGFVLDQLQALNASDPSGRFAGRLDLRRVGVFGHSLGGATALQFCHDDSRCKAGINIDGAPYGSVVQEGLRQPFMFLLGDYDTQSDPATIQLYANIRSIYDRLPKDKRLRVNIRGANHFNFNDGALLMSQNLQWGLSALGILGIDGRRQLAVTSYSVHSFFDVYLKGAPESKLEIHSSLYPEIQLLK